MDAKIKNRFEKFIYYSIDGCHYFTSGNAGFGYGAFWYKKKSIYAHRFSYLLYRGEIPTGLFVCHSCDNPACVNPDHLFLGTRQDNVNDMVSKGRQYNAYGEDRRNSKLTVSDVFQIRLLGQSLTNTAIAKIFKISQPQVSNIILKKSWK